MSALAPAGAADWLVDDLTEIATLLAITASEENVTRWAIVAGKSLQDMPSALVAEALHDAKLECRYSSEVVPFVSSYVVNARKPLERHGKALSRMLESENA